MKDDYRILDATCGRRIMWLDPRDSLTTYLDCDPEKWPDITCSCTDMPFPQSYFDLIVFDPPYKNFANLKKKYGNSFCSMAGRYGSMPSADIRELLKRAFIEFRRVLKPYGLILFKWSSCGFKLSKALSYLPDDMNALFGQRVAQRTRESVSTYWVTIQYRPVIPKTDAFDMQSIQSIIDNVEGPGIIKVDALG